MEQQAWSDIRIAKEKFVEGLTGGSVVEISAVLIIASLSGILSKLVSEKAQRNTRNPFWEFLVEYHTLVLPILLSLTLLSDWTWILLLVLLSFVVFLFAKGGFNDNVDSLQQSSSRIQFLMEVRALLCLATVIAILAVDFPLFPRRFAKTEFFGTSIMDAGVGCFVISMGVSRGLSTGSSKQNLMGTLRSAVPLLVLAAGRPAAIYMTSYQVHLSEYGAHWSFFMTLACLSLLMGLLHINMAKYGIISAIASLVVHQLILSLGVEEFVQNPLRGTDLVSQNREGVRLSFSFFENIIDC